MKKLTSHLGRVRHARVDAPENLDRTKTTNTSKVVQQLIEEIEKTGVTVVEYSYDPDTGDFSYVKPRRCSYFHYNFHYYYCTNHYK